ncbi:MAG: UxaA family hydrolase [Acutalibacteraceae bacterium]|jgi:altronate hydrolase
MKFIKIHKKDNVAVALTEIKKGESVEVDGVAVVAADYIPSGHKIALAGINKGENIIKYGFPIGHAKQDIAAGSHVHTHNTKSNLGNLLSYTYNPSFTELEAQKPRSFMGYKRPDGKAGIRNEVWIIPTVGCVNSIVRAIEQESQEFKTDNIDGIYSYCHPYGCSQLGDDQLNTLKFLCGLIRHPNAGAVLVVGLGCENGNIEELKKQLGDYDEQRVRFMVCQEHNDEIAEGIRLVKELCKFADRFSRTECPVSDLVIGLKCGGSDGFSGITANPLLGAVSDKLIAQGGSSILTEVPEMFGAETILMNRCRNEKLFEKTVELINGFKEYFMKYGEKTDENPSPGNKAGGITTLEDKSLGCVQKGGIAPVVDVLGYGEPIHKKGLSLLRAPGNDLVASNALVASGAHMVLFTTGRGTPFGCPVPTVKISSNSALAENKKAWIDFDAGRMLDGVPMESLADEFFEYIISVASGKAKTKSESLDKHDLAIFKDGVTL